MIKIHKFLNTKEITYLKNEIDKSSWKLNGRTFADDDTAQTFWCNDIFKTNALSLFQNKLENGLNRKIKITDLYANGQAHGQCGSWHKDIDYISGYENYFTFVYFYNEWHPEFGGHLLIKAQDEIISILPEYNYGVIFDSVLEHIALEPTVHCKSQRESVACKFRIINEQS